MTSPPVPAVKKSGFFYGYVIVVVGFFSLLVLYGTQYSFGVFFKPMLEEFGWSRTLTSGAYSMNVILQGFASLVAGQLSDRFGPRIVVTGSGILLGAGYLLMSTINTPWQIYLYYGFLISMGSCIWVPFLSAVARWFTKGRGLMSGVVSAGIGAGILLMPPIANQLIAHNSWRASYMIVGLIALVIIVAGGQLLKRSPDEARATPSGGGGQAKARVTGPADEGLSFKEAIRTSQCWVFALIFFAANLSTQVVMVHIVPHATDIEISAVAAATIMSVIGASSIVSKVGFGSVVDRLGGKRVTIICSALMAFAFLLAVRADTLWMLYIFGALFAFAYGGFSAAQSPTVAEYFGLKAHGAILGTILIGNFVGGAIGPLVAGRIFDTTGRYFYAFLLCIAVSAIGLIGAATLKPMKKRTPAEVRKSD
jgi:MFS family permease